MLICQGFDEFLPKSQRVLGISLTVSPVNLSLLALLVCPEYIVKVV